MLDKALTVLGFQNNQIKVIECLITKKRASQYEIERESGLRQPEVSIALSALKKEGFVIFDSDTGSERGRPTKHYYLLKAPIIERLRKQIGEKYQNECAAINEVEKAFYDNL